MDSKQAPPSYSEAAGVPPPAGYNTGYAPPPGNQGPYAPPPANPGSYPPGSYPAPQAGGYPAGYVQPPGYPPQQGYAPTGGHAYQQTVVVSQPINHGMAVQGAVPDHMGLAIFVTICCCWPLGLVAIMRAQESRRALERGDINSARTFSGEARRYSMWAIAGGFISIVVAVVIIVLYITSFTY